MRPIIDWLINKLIEQIPQKNAENYQILTPKFMRILYSLNV